LADFYVMVSDQPFASAALDESRVQPGVTAYHVDLVAGKVDLPVGRDGRYVRIQLNGKNPLSLAEVEVRRSAPIPVSPYRNVALAARTTQSSVANGGLPTRAQDGNFDGLWANQSLSHTTSEQNPWWQADLGASKQLTSVVVWNRVDCCADRLKDFYVFTSDQPFASTDLAATLKQPGVRSHHVRDIGRSRPIVIGRTARYVRVQSALTGYLTLAEVQIFSDEKLVAPDVAKQVRENQFGMFIHYGLGTYTNEQWATPNTPPSVFHPTALDTDQWAAAAKSAGMKYGVLTTKHHDGFALWDTASNSYDVASSPYQGDVVRKYADSFRKAGLNVGLYYSIWDRSNGESMELVINQIRELLTQYGYINQLWFDGWGFPGYGKIGFDQVRDFVRNVSPGTVIVNNDKNDTLATSDMLEYEDGRPPAGLTSPVQMSDMISTSNWDWFNTDQSVEPRTTADIVDEETYQRDHGYQYLLNVGPSKDGRMAKVYTDRLAEVGAALGVNSR
jgi:alpha-L-fucosidase